MTSLFSFLHVRLSCSLSLRTRTPNPALSKKRSRFPCKERFWSFQFIFSKHWIIFISDGWLHLPRQILYIWWNRTVFIWLTFVEVYWICMSWGLVWEVPKQRITWLHQIYMSPDIIYRNNKPCWRCWNLKRLKMKEWRVKNSGFEGGRHKFRFYFYFLMTKNSNKKNIMHRLHGAVSML